MNRNRICTPSEVAREFIKIEREQCLKHGLIPGTLMFKAYGTDFAKKEIDRRNQMFSIIQCH